MGSIARNYIWLYRAKKFGILFFFIAYSVLQCAGQAYSTRGEYFPVFGWSLFSDVTSPRLSLETEVFRVGKTVFPEPLNFFELDEHFPAAKARSSDLQKTAVQMLKHAQDPAAVAALRQVFEETYLSGNRPVEYQLVVVKFDPIVRWQTGKVIDRRIVGRFSTDEGK